MPIVMCRVSINQNSSKALLKWLAIFPLLLAAVMLAGTAALCFFEDMSFGQAMYASVIAASTVGYSEPANLDTAGRICIVFIIIFGVALSMATMTVAVAALTEGVLRNVIGRRHVQKTIDKLSGHTIVCGYGRMGSMVAEQLSEYGREIVVIEIDADKMERMTDTPPLYITGDAQDESVLESAGIERASHLVACLADDADNVFLTLTARQLNGSLEIVARSQQPRTEKKLIRAGARRVICPEIIGANRMADVIVRPVLVDFVEMSNRGVELEMEQVRVLTNSEFAGKTLKDIALPAKCGAMVVAVKRASDGKTIYTPGPNVNINPGDLLIMVGQKGTADQVEAAQMPA